jgi:hypothetical protein
MAMLAEREGFEHPVTEAPPGVIAPFGRSVTVWLGAGDLSGASYVHSKEAPRGPE